MKVYCMSDSSNQWLAERAIHGWLGGSSVTGRTGHQGLALIIVYEINLLKALSYVRHSLRGENDSGLRYLLSFFSRINTVQCKSLIFRLVSNKNLQLLIRAQATIPVITMNP